MAILFGTDGWRAVIAEDFTFANVELVARAAAQFFKKQPNAERGIVVGYDARFLSDRFAATVARVFASEGMKEMFIGDLQNGVLQFTKWFTGVTPDTAGTWDHYVAKVRRDV